MGGKIFCRLKKKEVGETTPTPTTPHEKYLENNRKQQMHGACEHIRAGTYASDVREPSTAQHPCRAQLVDSSSGNP